MNTLQKWSSVFRSVHSMSIVKMISIMPWLFQQLRRSSTVFCFFELNTMFLFELGSTNQPHLIIFMSFSDAFLYAIFSPTAFFLNVGSIPLQDSESKWQDNLSRIQLSVICPQLSVFCFTSCSFPVDQHNRAVPRRLNQITTFSFPHSSTPNQCHKIKPKESFQIGLVLTPTLVLCVH